MKFKKILLFFIPLFLISFAFASFIISDIFSSDESNDTFNIVAFDTIDNSNFFIFKSSTVFDFFNTGFVGENNTIINNGDVLIDFSIDTANLLEVYPDNKEFIVSLDLINYAFDDSSYFDFINSTSFSCSSCVLDRSVDVISSNSLLKFKIVLDNNLDNLDFSIKFNFTCNENNFNEFFRNNVFSSIFNTRFKVHALILV